MFTPRRRRQRGDEERATASTAGPGRGCGPVAPSARLVSASDKLHNARCILADYRELGDALWARFNPDAGREGTLWYYRALVNAFAEHARNRLVGELDRVVTELEKIANAPPRGD